METTFRIWLTSSTTRPPTFDAFGTRVVRTESIAADGWDVTVTGDGSDFENAARDHPDIAIVERRPPAPSG